MGLLNFIKDAEKSLFGAAEAAEPDADVLKAEIDKLAAREWKSYISNMAWDKVKDDFSEISRQIFEASMHEDSNAVLAEKFAVAESSVRVYKMRVRKTLLKEIVRLNQELGG